MTHPGGEGNRLAMLARRAAGATPVARRELLLLGAAMAVGLVVRLVFVALTTGHALGVDETEYHNQGRFITEGMWFWSLTPTGEPHESMWKAPGYPLFVGIWYSILGVEPDRLFALQALLGPVTIGLTWLLGRRLFGPTVGLLAAALVAVYPFAWQFEVRLYSESIAVPLGLALLIVVLGRHPTPARAAAAGALLGVNLLVRPSSILLLAGVALAWWIAAGPRRGTAMVAVSVAVAVIVVAPWTIRNHEVSGGFVPISIQDAAGYGVFNDDSANDPDKPWAWRATTTREADLVARLPEISELEFREELRSRMFDYIRENPSSVPKAFFWNGITRLWDLRRPAHVLDEVEPTGRSEAVTWVGLAMYWVLLPLALYGLWRIRARRDIVIPLLGIAFAASVVYTLDATTRYRAPLEPVIAILACVALVALWRARQGTAEGEREGALSAGAP